MKYVIENETNAITIKKVRKRMGMTQKAFAEFLGCSKPTVERWEANSDKIKGPIAVLINLLQYQMDPLDEYQIPEKKYPLRMWYMYGMQKCTLIEVDDLNEKVFVKNYCTNRMFQAFGVNEHPTYQDYQEFLKSRCFPEQRDKMKLILKELGLPFYDPFLIIKKTEGRMEEDDFWIDVEE